MKIGNHVRIVSAIVSLLFLILCTTSVKLNFVGGWEGIYLLSTDSWRIEVTDDLFPEDSARFITGLSFGNIANKHHLIATNGSKISAEWNSKQGRGFIKNVFPDGKKLLINISRYKTLEDMPLSGVFIGGGLPQKDIDYNAEDKNETGMSYFDGTRWFHVWCYANEAVGVLTNPNITIGPDRWHFVSSRLVENSNSEITIESEHKVVLDGVPIKIMKMLFYEAGDSFFTVVTRFINNGKKTVTILYMYGDEPWLGDYGSSEGNVGWLKGGVVKTEQSVNVNTNTYAGFFDYGNDLANEQHNYTMKANFIEWEEMKRPESVYFSNQIGLFSLPGIDGKKAVLSSPDSRFLGLQWKQRLEPKQSYSLKLAIGLAENDPKHGFPKKPLTRLNK